MDYRIKAHPTMYKGTQFRSRLEATWAAYFDLRQIVWSYEPVDLIGWSPDFGLQWQGHEILAEVKPILSPRATEPSYDKAVDHSDKAWVLLLGRDPTPRNYGWLLDHPQSVWIENDPWWSFHDRFAPGNMVELWREATNLTRWRAA